MKVLIFLHGTTIMHSSGKDQPREVRVQQSKRRDPEVLDYSSYVPIGDAVAKVKSWRSQGAEILYLSSHRTKRDFEKDKFVLRKYGFPEGETCYRRWWQSYRNVVTKISPDILIEDDCESIGGEREMISPSLKSDARSKVKTVVVKEFQGVDSLPDDLSEF